MLPISGIYEVAIKVKDLATAEKFYREVLDLQIGLRDSLFLTRASQYQILQVA